MKLFDYEIVSPLPTKEGGCKLSPVGKEHVDKINEAVERALAAYEIFRF